jgi:hypothetical protein
LKRQGKLHAALVYNPITDELFTAERGGGAFMNDRRIRVAASRPDERRRIATGTPARPRRFRPLPQGTRRDYADRGGHPPLRGGGARPRLGSPPDASTGFGNATFHLDRRRESC